MIFFLRYFSSVLLFVMWQLTLWSWSLCVHVYLSKQTYIYLFFACFRYRLLYSILFFNVFPLMQALLKHLVVIISNHWLFIIKSTILESWLQTQVNRWSILNRGLNCKLIGWRGRFLEELYHISDSDVLKTDSEEILCHEKTNKQRFQLRENTEWL